MTLRPPWWTLVASHVVTMLSYANSMLNPLLYAAFNENLRVGFARACHCLARRRGSRGTLTAANTRGGGHSTTGRVATEQNRLRLTTRSEDRKSVGGHGIEVVEIVTVSGRMAPALDDVVAVDEPKSGKGEWDALVVEDTRSAPVVVDVANPAVNTTDNVAEDTPM